jgi:hypothetical protein
MPEYIVEVIQTSAIDYRVEADSPEEAKSKVDELGGSLAGVEYRNDVIDDDIVSVYPYDGT